MHLFLRQCAAALCCYRYSRPIIAGATCEASCGLREFVSTNAGQNDSKPAVPKPPLGAKPFRSRCSLCLLLSCDSRRHRYAYGQQMGAVRCLACASHAENAKRSPKAPLSSCTLRWCAHKSRAAYYLHAPTGSHATSHTPLHSNSSNNLRSESASPQPSSPCSTAQFRASRSRRACR